MGVRVIKECPDASVPLLTVSHQIAMNHIPGFLAGLLVCSLVHGAAIASDDIVGSYKFFGENETSSLTLLLECRSEVDCTYTNLTKSTKGPPYKETQLLKLVQPVKTIDRAASALKYAIAQKDHEFQQQDDRDLMTQLRPVFLSNPSISKCWDLNYQQPEFMLACTLSHASPNSPPLYLFAGTLSNCRPSDAFCGYAIFPMWRAN